MISSNNFSDDKPVKGTNVFASDKPSQSANAFAQDMPSKNSDYPQGGDTTYADIFGGTGTTFGDVYAEGWYGRPYHFKNRTENTPTHS